MYTIDRQKILNDNLDTKIKHFYVSLYIKIKKYNFKSLIWNIKKRKLKYISNFTIYIYIYYVQSKNSIIHTLIIIVYYKFQLWNKK